MDTVSIIFHITEVNDFYKKISINGLEHNHNVSMKFSNLNGGINNLIIIFVNDRIILDYITINLQ